MGRILEIIGQFFIVIIFVNFAFFAMRTAPAFSWMFSKPTGQVLNTARKTTGPSNKFVSVHLAVHDEPADVVIATLAALGELHYDNFEVLVIDNNTPLPATWMPVSDYCHGNPRLRFFHFSDVQGAKAGALNIALRLMNPATDYVAVIDADYQVIPEFLEIAVAECEQQAHQFVQFPQAYRAADRASAIDRELSDYFAVYSSPASHAGAMLPTGTLSLICAATLRKVGGWPTSSVTEDAEIGMRMWRLGASGRYVDRVVGRGMLPLDLHGLRRQRYRWAAGNARTLLSHLTSGVSEWPEHGRWSVVAQLTAWFGFAAVPLFALAAALAAHEIARDVGPVWRGAEQFASMSLLIVLMTLVVTAFARGRPDTLPVKLAMLWTSSFAWLPQLWRSTTPFLRTPKVATALPFRVSLDTGVSLFALIMAIAYIRLGHIFPGLVLGCSASTLVFSPLVDSALRLAAKGQDAGRQVFG